MTSLKMQNLVDATCGFLCGFFFMSFECFRGHLSDLSFAAALSCVAVSFAFMLIRNLRKHSGDNRFNFFVSAMLPVAIMMFYSLLMIGSAYNPEPKPVWIIACLAMSLGMIGTSLAVSIAPALAIAVEQRILRR